MFLNQQFKFIFENIFNFVNLCHPNKFNRKEIKTFLAFRENFWTVQRRNGSKVIKLKLIKIKN